MPDDPLEPARRRMAAAVTEHDLISAAAQAHDAVTEFIATRSGAATVAEGWSSLVRTALIAAARLVGADRGVWYASGSVGRGDALPGSDLETLFVRADDSTPDAALAHAAQVHELLGACDFRGDDNGAIAARVRFNRTAREWADAMGDWSADPAADRGVVMIGLLADALPVTAGPDLRGQAGTATRAHPAALAAMLQDATYIRAHVPSRLRLLTTGDDGVDIKLAAVDPVVRIARWAALSCGSDALSTRDRLRDGAGSTYLDSLDARELDKCHAIGSSIRWRVRAARWNAALPGNHSGEYDDRVDLSTLSPQDRTALRSIGREINGIRRKLDYLASTSAFSAW
ncbi:putative nucleotidyltransferase substrate binding domain-containing protein [Mycobacterium sp. 852013-50091_SCH5140682]|uniref:putative nucleotidyltransferase substrate binding domain-containing protein n=1 Tax=Mycobacterium sp. 852013-50091_SCH5140682 TaxID=1834109 RepID=UPI0009EEB59D|nr:putative nucleotidyltransferase substrate binding domain-containing protein [Mycobacterium sp. 852013-50091_SCH5140682]